MYLRLITLCNKYYVLYGRINHYDTDLLVTTNIAIRYNIKLFLRKYTFPHILLLKHILDTMKG